MGSAAVYFALATMNAWPNLDAALQGDHKAAAMAFVQYTFAFIVAISSVASAHEKGGQIAVLVFMTVNAYFAYDAASHRHDEAHTTASRKAIVSEELTANSTKLEKMGVFDRVSDKQIKAAEEKIRLADEFTRCFATCTGSRASRAQAVKTAQADLDQLLPLRKKTEDAEKLEDAIIKGKAELKTFKETGDSDNSLASMAGGNKETLATAITLLIALGIELANKYGPFWTFRFLIGGLGYPQASPYEIRKAQRAAEKTRKAREAEEAEARRLEAEARFKAEAEARIAAEAEEKARAERATKRTVAKTREKGDPATVERWTGSGAVILDPSQTVLQSEAYDAYAADCEARGEKPVAKGKRFADELRKLGFGVRDRGREKRSEIHGLALSRVGRPALRVVSSC